MLTKFKMFPLLEFDICRIFWKVLFLAVLIPFFGVSQLAENQDTTQIIVVQKVSSCPVTKEKWIEERKAKNCSSINVTLKYHCLLNHWRNQSFVLCGEDTDIIGFFCPEYDERRGKIQENQDLKCIQLNTPCPIKYNSSDVYKYTACINTNITGTSNPPKKDNIDGYIFWFVALTVFIIVMIFLLFFLIRARLKRGYICCTFKGYPKAYSRKGRSMWDDAGPSFQDLEMSSMMDDPRPSFQDFETECARPVFRHFGTIAVTGNLGYNYGGSSYQDWKSMRHTTDQLITWLLRRPGQHLGDLETSLSQGPCQQGHIVHLSQPIEGIGYLHSLFIKYYRLPTSDLSFANELLRSVKFLDIIIEVTFLSRKVTLNNTFETTTESHEPGKVYVAEVTVTCEKKQLIVKPKVSSFCL